MTKNVDAKAWSITPAAGRGYSLPPPENPPWLAGLSANTWTDISNNTQGAVQAANGGQYGGTGPDAVLNNWGSAVVIMSYGRSGTIFHRNGGHGDYYGTELYAFDLYTALWSRFNSPSTAGNADSWVGPYTNGILSDGTPNVEHNYYFQYERAGRYCTHKRQVTNAPTAVYMPSQFNPFTGGWSNSTVTFGTIAPTNDEGACYDVSRDRAYVMTTNPAEWGYHDFRTDTATDSTLPTGALQPQSGPVFCPSLTGGDAVVEFVNNAVWVFDPANIDADKVAVTTSGTSPTRGVGDGASWDPINGCIVYYPSTSNTIYTLTPPGSDWRSGTWVWAQITMSGTTGTHTGQGTYRKFNVTHYGTVSVATLCGNPNGGYYVVKLVP